MKLVLSLFLSLITSTALACQQEAQVIATIKESVKVGTNSCIVYIDSNQVRFHAASYACPLEISEIAIEGVDVGLNKALSCNLQPGEELNGIVVRIDSGLILE